MSSPCRPSPCVPVNSPISGEAPSCPFTSAVLAKRVRDAAALRVRLLGRREDFYNQLNGINHFLWSYDQQKILAGAAYERQIVDLQRRRNRAVNSLISKKNDYIRLQREMAKRLDAMDRELAFYALDGPPQRKEAWEYDHESELPVLKGPGGERGQDGGVGAEGRKLEHPVKWPF